MYNGAGIALSRCALGPYVQFQEVRCFLRGREYRSTKRLHARVFVTVLDSKTLLILFARF